MGETAAILGACAAFGTMCVAVATLVVSIKNGKKSDKTHSEVSSLSVAVDGRLTELLNLTRTSSKAEGLKEGRDDPRA